MKSSAKQSSVNTSDQSVLSTGLDAQKLSFYLQKYRRYGDMNVDNRKFPGLDPRDLEYEILSSYQLAVESRSNSLILDEPTRRHIDAVARWITVSDKRWLLLSGPNGNGKTTMLVALRKLLRARFVTAQELELKALGRCSLEEYYLAHVLIIDDIGKESENILVYGTPVPVIANVFRRRYSRNLVTIVSSNNSIEELAERYGDDVSDRFSESMCVLNFTNQSYRRKEW